MSGEKILVRFGQNVQRILFKSKSRAHYAEGAKAFPDPR